MDDIGGGVSFVIPNNIALITGRVRSQSFYENEYSPGDYIPMIVGSCNLLCG